MILVIDMINYELYWLLMIINVSYSWLLIIDYIFVYYL